MKAQDAVLINKKYFEILLGEHELLPEKAIMVEEDDGGTLYYCTRNVPPIAAFDFEHSDPESLPAIYAHLDGFDYEAENQRYWLMNSGKLIMNADTLKQNGLEMELEAPKHRLADNGRTSAVITLWVEGEPVAKLELTREEEKEDHTYLFTVAPQDLPPAPADGKYNIKITQEAVKPLTEGARIYSLSYLGIPTYKIETQATAVRALK